VKGFITTIAVDGKTTSRELDKVPPLEVLREGVGGGHIEHIPYWDTIMLLDLPHPACAFCHEESKLNGMDVNWKATVLWHAQAPHMAGQDVLCGPVVVLYGDPEFMADI